MPQQKPLANLSAEYLNLKKILNSYNNVNSTLEITVGDTNGTGMSMGIHAFWKSLKASFDKIPDLFFGKNTTNSKKKASNPMEYGLAGLAGLLASVDLCSIMTSISNLNKNLPGSTKFNPKQSPPPNDPKWKIQLVAYEIQTSIDLFEAAYATTGDPSTAILNLIAEISPNMTKLGSSNYLGSPDIKKSYPQVNQFGNFINDKLSKYSNITVISNTDKTTINTLLKSFTLLRQTCVLIQGLTTPASLATYAASALDPATFKMIDKFLGPQNINPQALSRTIATMQTVIGQLDRILSETLRVIKSIQDIIKVSLILVKVFKVLVNFFQALPLPNMYTTIGVSTTMARTTDKLDQYSKDTIKLLNEINLIISIVVGLIQGVVATLELILVDLNKILDNLTACNRDNTDPAMQNMVQPLKATISTLTASNNELKAFVQNYQAKKSNTANTYYGYTIQILTETISDPQVQKITIPRRYGIALNSAGIAVVETTPTFASDDNVIVNEVKLLLREKNLIKTQASSLSDADMAVINESMSILGDNSITMGDLPMDSATEQADAPDNEDDNQGLGINAFFNKQKGGKKLRKKISKIMGDQKTKLNSDLQNVKK